MKIQPRQQLLDIWRAAARASFKPGRGGGWQWGGRAGTNSIGDAEQLLCIMFPATEIPRFRLDRPNETEEDVLNALKVMGNALEIPRLLVRVITDYLERYSEADGTPVFPGGSYFTARLPEEQPTEEQLNLDVVDSFAASITLMLSALGFAKVFKAELSREDLRNEVTRLEAMANKRLSAAMVGLLRSFSISVYDQNDATGQALLRTVNQDRRPQRQVVAELLSELRETAAGLRDLTYGVTQAVDDLESSGQLFECGWSWGITESSPRIEWAGDVGRQRDGYAFDAPYLYFTVVALDGISDLFTKRTRLLGLLDDDQQRLATALQKRYELTQKYWSTIASFGQGRWPLEDIPWRTADEVESDFFSLLVTSISARDLAERRDTDADLGRLGRILTELANRARITRRPYIGDPATELHLPGVSVALEGSEKLGPELSWIATDFAPLLLKRTVKTAALINNIQLRGELLQLADDIWDHISRRRIVDDCHGKDLWDQPGQLFPAIDFRFTSPSWHHTVRVVESLVTSALLTDTHPLRSDELTRFTSDLLAEAEHLFDQELLAGSTEGGKAMRDKLTGVRQRVQRARDIASSRPGSALALLMTVLQELDDLAAARDVEAL